MSLEQWSWIAQIVGTAAVVVSLLFVASQIRQNTRALERNEHNSTMAQWTVIRQAIATDRRIAELMSAGLAGDRELDAADRLSLEHMLQEVAWAGFHIWDRTQRGVFPAGTFEATGGVALCDALGTPRGAAWWSANKHRGFVPAFVADVDAMLGRAQAGATAGRRQG